MSWEQLKNTFNQNRQAKRMEATAGVEACPIDGEVLVVRADGIRSCPLGNFTWRGGQGVVVSG
jgi:hypothetical protein